MTTSHQNRRPSPVPLTAGRALCAAVVLAGIALAGCSKDRPAAADQSAQVLASVNGDDITAFQLDQELQHAGVPAPQQQAARKQLLQALIDRELLETEAGKEKIDRDPKVLQAIERARSQIIAQAYLQKRVGNVEPATQSEIEDYYNKHPLFFAKRRQFALDQLVLPASAVTPELRAMADGARSLDEVAAYLDRQQIAYGRAGATRSSADLAPEVSARLLSMPKGQLFFVQEGQRATLAAIDTVRDAPVSLANAAPQIAQYLASSKSKERAQAELQRLRATARIDYPDQGLAPVP